ncbi:MAG TPA: hypothetical protein VM848_19715 [Acidimicrobiia bacterium]|nr:hypothetical protein [Acidimicrobiia bacterium]
MSSAPVRRGRDHADKTANVYAIRPLKVYAFDPQLGRRRRYRITLEIPYEELAPGPSGRLIRVVDYDAGSGRYYKPVNLDLPELRAGGGLEPNVGNPEFHQQMVYAVAMKVIANFERALGRRLRFDPLTVLPHAFEGRNAFFHPPTNAICLGYYRADPEDPGENIPSQLVFTCLSHDIVAHEVTHALVHRLRPAFNYATNPDVKAFHEGIADIVAIFQHFAYPGVLSEAIQESGGDLSKPGPLIELARQFGQTTAQGAALRKARDEEEQPDPTEYRRAFEPHNRGAILVRAVFDAFFTTYSERVKDLVRLGAGTGDGKGHLHPDLVVRLTDEAADTAQRVLDLCIRAFDYLPPVDLTYGDYLRALVTADSELNPDDPFDLRANLVDSFLARGVYPSDVLSLNEESMLWPAADTTALFDPLEEGVLGHLLIADARSWGAKRTSYSYGDGEESEKVAAALQKYAKQNHIALGLEEDTIDNPISVRGFHTMFRVGDDGLLLTEASVQFAQKRKEDDDPTWGGVQPRAGTTVIFSGDGTPRYIISKPLPNDTLRPKTKQQAEERLAAMRAFVAESDDRDPHFSWEDDEIFPLSDRMLRRYDFSAVHQGIRRQRPPRGKAQKGDD